MKKNTLFFTFILTSFTASQPLLCRINENQNIQKSAVTFALNGGRLGDDLLNYWRAKHFAYINNLPFLCPHFTYKNRLNLHRLEKPYGPEQAKKFRRIIRLKSDNNLNVTKNNILYKVDFYFKSRHGMGFNDATFMAIMKTLIKPINPMPTIIKPSNRLNIAIHVRYGSGYDPSFRKAQKIHPLKFPPFSFYIDALKKIIELTNNQPVHLTLFTDAKNPKPIYLVFKQAFSKYDITINYRSNNKNAHKDAVLNDLFSMAQFDYLIRSNSGLSKIAQFIGKHKIIIYPEKPIWHGRDLKIEKLGIKLAP